jgi:type IV pilus assembly PilO-like protein
MERINGRLALVLAATLVLVVVLVGWFALVSPQRSKAASLDGQIGDANVKLASTQAFMQSPEAHQSVERLAQVRRAVPEDVNMSEILRQLSSAAARSGVRIDSITPSAPVAAAGAQAVPIALSVNGRYFRLAKFMHLLRTRAAVKDGKLHVSGRLYAVDNISFSSSGKGGLITGTLALDAFMQGAAPATPTTTAGGQTTTPTP